MNREPVNALSNFATEFGQKLQDLTIIHHVDEEGALWATRNRLILKVKDEKPHAVCRFPWLWPRDLFGFFRLSARVARADKCSLFVSKDGRILGIRGGTVYAITAGDIRPLFRINGDNVLHQAICEDDTGNLYFGEYLMNPERIPVRIWRVRPDWSHDVAYEFRDPLIRHVHGVHRDPYSPGDLWVTTGDFSGECYIWKTTNNFQTLERFGSGEQDFRALKLFFTPDHVCWLTDSHISQNYAFRMSRETGDTERGQELDASAWYGAQLADGPYVAFTTVEDGPAIQTDKCSMLVSEDAFHWTVVRRFKKDIYRPTRVFKHGVVICPSGKLNSSSIYLSGEGLVGLDGQSIRLSLVRDSERSNRVASSAK